MALALQAFDHQTPSVPTLSRGMLLGASGVSAPPIQTIGNMLATSSANGSFNDILGLSQMASYGGYLYVADKDNLRWQRFSKGATGLFTYDSKLASSSALGSSLAADLIAIDQSRAQIHLASSGQNIAGTWIGVWNLSDWPNLTTGNRVRSYGTQSGSNGSGNARAAQAMTIVGDITYVVSSAGDLRLLAWNHTTGSLVAEATRTFISLRFASDGTRYYSGSQSGVDAGLVRMNPATLANTARLDQPLPAGLRYTRQNYFYGGNDILDLLCYGSRLYGRCIRDGRIFVYDTTTDLFVDEFAWNGGASATETYGHAPGEFFALQIPYGKMGLYLHNDTSKSDDLLAWSGNARGTAQQSFLTVWPLTTATATWTKNDFSTGTNTIKAISLQGTQLSGEKYKIRLRKNAGAWVTVLPSQVCDLTQLSSVGTFTSGDTLTVELSLSVADRLDGHASLVFCRDKLTPTNVSLRLTYEDTAADVFVPQQTGSFSGAIGDTGFSGRLQ